MASDEIEFSDHLPMNLELRYSKWVASTIQQFRDNPGKWALEPTVPNEFAEGVSPTGRKPPSLPPWNFVAKTYQGMEWATVDGARWWRYIEPVKLPWWCRLFEER